MLFDNQRLVILLFDRINRIDKMLKSKIYSILILKIP